MNTNQPARGQEQHNTPAVHQDPNRPQQAPVTPPGKEAPGQGQNPSVPGTPAQPGHPQPGGHEQGKHEPGHPTPGKPGQAQPGTR
ncbi:hypothetical protein CDEF62S_04374 [Castellaniella defragrans]